MSVRDLPARLRRKARRRIGAAAAAVRARSAPDTPIRVRPRRGGLVMIIVVDGLRPDSLGPETTPNLERLRERGVTFTDAHSVFPTDTRVNAASIATGVYPGRHGLMGNTMVVPDGSGRSLSTQRADELLGAREHLGGDLLLVESLGEVLARHGRRLAAVSSASTGSALCLNPRAPEGIGILVNGAFDPGVRVAYPDDANRRILRRFGPAPQKAGHGRPREALVTWTQRVLMELVVPEDAPDVVIDWITEPDHLQHAHGVGSPQALAALEGVDRSIGYVLERLEAMGLAGDTDVIVASDHGVTRFEDPVDVRGALREAGLGDGHGLVVTTNGPRAQVSCDDPARIREIVRFLHAQPWSGPIFTRPRGASPADPLGAGEVDGAIAGTFSLDLVHLDNRERGFDVLVTLPWSSEPNEFGVPGRDVVAAGGKRELHSGHGSMSPWAIRTTLIASGPGFRTRSVVDTPVGQVDLAPTALHLLGLDVADGFDGRVLTEALEPDGAVEVPAVERRTVTTESADGSYRAAIQLSTVGAHRYVDKGWRL